jgi:outer membrane immunogenic protein
MKKIIVATVLAAIGSTSTLAADLGARAPYTKAPAMAALANWSGFYVGANVGYGWGSGHTEIVGLPDPEFGLPRTALDTNPKGVIGGAQIGYNWQVGSLVTGLEADIQGSGIKGSTSRTVSIGGGPATLTASEKLNWFGTVRGRLGFSATPDLLLYGTGGLAYGSTPRRPVRQRLVGLSEPAPSGCLHAPGPSRLNISTWTWAALRPSGVHLSTNHSKASPLGNIRTTSCAPA